ncbi:Uncharacterized protein F383_19299 [Gossypium arboreum]|uniref:Uncharacterized protein n=1 Tax=Gossypium arboreum TaxID=29729 RepID=A0A0B0NL81_GOSAR|nr:Uncharacterized protein F383_19299 [Gossypium arboreum]
MVQRASRYSSLEHSDRLLLVSFPLNSLFVSFPDSARSNFSILAIRSWFFVNFSIMALMSYPLYSQDKLPDRLFMSFPKWLCVSFSLQGSRVYFPIICPNWVPLKMN